ncbi:DUF4922 domain-containing protein [Enterococcus ureasiticus]|uniref:DUF4922 domain-containing protein n=1 Tax=Enterococcus ureasiticus TaxID=903984 RepID=A0A1E5GCC1_9ENTE|nr:DUF4922 domain-containing protein [Enterococcus ureasiticus]OEG10348.1 hypothetical protein BCR21_13445 [Enterococcus ureasiticus]
MFSKYDRKLSVMDMECIVRFIPSLIKRYNEWDQKSLNNCNCPFCERWLNSSKSISQLFHIIKNDYPFMVNQFTIFGNIHEEFLNSVQIKSALKLINDMPSCQSGGVQIFGSGASIPQHAHFSISNEKYPISILNRSVILTTKTFQISRILGIPHLALVVSGQLEDVSSITYKISQTLRYKKLSYNLLLTDNHEIIVIPRIRENSVSLGRKVGVSFVGGIYPCYVKNMQPYELSESVLNEMFYHWQTVNSSILLQALVDTTLPSTLQKNEVFELIEFDTILNRNIL